MPKTLRLAPVIGACIALLTLTSCSSGGEQGATPVEAELTGEAVPLDAEQAALCEQIVAQGLPVGAASALAEASGYTYVVVESGQDSGATAGTLVFTSANDVVVDCAVA